MACISAYLCSVCGATKGEGNKWLLGMIIDRGTQNDHHSSRIELGIGRAVFFDSVRGYGLIQWDAWIASEYHLQVDHLCSEKCALTKQREFIRP